MPRKMNRVRDYIRKKGREEEEEEFSAYEPPWIRDENGERVNLVLQRLLSCLTLS